MLLPKILQINIKLDVISSDGNKHLKKVFSSLEFNKQRRGCKLKLLLVLSHSFCVPAARPGENVGIEELLLRADGLSTWYSYYGNQYGGFSKILKSTTNRGPATLLLDIYCKISKAFQSHTWITVLNAVLFTLHIKWI